MIVIATSFKDKKGVLYLPQAFPGEFAASRDGTLYMAARLLKPQFINIAAAPQRCGQDIGQGSVFGRLGQMFEDH